MSRLALDSQSRQLIMNIEPSPLFRSVIVAVLCLVVVTEQLQQHTRCMCKGGQACVGIQRPRTRFSTAISDRERTCSYVHEGHFQPIFSTNL
jgi:hypothetical protein